MSQNRLALQLLSISSGAFAMKSRDDTPAVKSEMCVKMYHTLWFWC